MNKTVEYENVIAFHPAIYIEDLLRDLNISVEEFANKLNIPANEIIDGTLDITDDIALKLSDYFKTSTSFWININNTYKEKILEIDKLKNKHKY